MTALIGFCGASGSGKTTLVSAVIAELTKRGLKVGAIKHHGHAGALQTSPDGQTKDSDLLAQAGAERVALVHAGGVWLFAPPEWGQAEPPQIAAQFMQGLDLVLVEGFKTAAIDKIEVVAPGKKPIMPDGGKLLAITRRGNDGGGDTENGLLVLNADAPSQVAEFVVDHMPKTGLTGGSNIKLSVNGKDLDLNPFVGHLIELTIKGLVRNLKGGADPNKIEVSISD
jgi:molybdopterin-guanine dinucleotide biosynthesis protein B